MRAHRIALPAFIFATLTCVDGCGGGGSSASTPVQPTGSTQQVGPFTMRLQGSANLQPLAVSSGATEVTGVAGGTITALEMVGKPDLASTRLILGIDDLLSSVHPDGSDEKVLTVGVPNPAVASFPAISIYGTLAFGQKGADGLVHVYEANPDGSNVHTVGAGSTNDAEPKWSPDGTKIAFARFTASTTTQITVMNADGSSPTARSDGAHYDVDPTWSPDGAKIVFARLDSGGNNGVLYLNSGGTSASPLASSVAGYSNRLPDWSPDGTTIAEEAVSSGGTGNASLAFLSATGNLNYVLPVPSGGQDGNPYWSPDGRRLAWVRFHTSPATASVMVGDSDATNGNAILSGLSGDTGLAWSPFPYRFYIGAGGLLNASAAGFMFSQSADGIDSVLDFGATTPTTATITKDPNSEPGSSTVIFDLKADHITALRYVDDLYGMPVTVLPAGGFSTASGVIVSYSAATGHLQSILPYSATRARPNPASRKLDGKLVLDGSFLAAIDCVSGKNLAPKGATSVVLNAETGRIAGS